MRSRRSRYLFLTRHGRRRPIGKHRGSRRRAYSGTRDLFSIGGAFAPLWLAQDKGRVAKYGLAVDMEYSLSATGTEALLSGSVDIVNPATESSRLDWAARESPYHRHIESRRALDLQQTRVQPIQ